MTMYEDVQNQKPLWVLVLVIVVAALNWWGLIQQIVFGRPWGNNPTPDWVMWLLLLLIGIGLPVFYWMVRLTITIDDEKIHIHYRPLTSRTISLTEIESVTIRQYNPITEYGGWGIRVRPGKRAYTMRGNIGVELQLTSGQTVMLSSNSPESLAKAINTRL